MATAYITCALQSSMNKKIIVREINNNLKPTENFSKSSFRLNNPSDPGARTCVSKKVDCCVAPAHPPLPFRRNNMSPRLHTQKCKRAPRCHTRHWIYLKTAEMRFLDWIPYEKSFQNWNNKQQKKSKSDSCEDIYINTVHAPPLKFKNFLVKSGACMDSNGTLELHVLLPTWRGWGLDPL